jgi:hypothetical protein
MTTRCRKRRIGCLIGLLFCLIGAPVQAGDISASHIGPSRIGPPRISTDQPIMWSGTFHDTASRNARYRLMDPSRLCEVAIAKAEAQFSLPSGLLLAIALVESGRLEPRSGRIRPWPWSINAAGQGVFFESAAEAVQAVRGLQKQGVVSIDIGCLQVNQMFHPVFASLPDAFDPEENAAYAAGFLRQLYAETGSWSVAAGLYHSRTPVLAASYRQAVAVRLTNSGAVRQLQAASAHEIALQKLQAAWAATLVDKVSDPAYQNPSFARSRDADVLPQSIPGAARKNRLTRPIPAAWTLGIDPEKPSPRRAPTGPGRWQSRHHEAYTPVAAR